MKRFALLFIVFIAAAGVLAQNAPSPTDLYNQACYLALAGKKDEAFTKLREAFALGWSNAEHLQRDTDLDSLHDDPRWQPLVDEMKAAAAREQKKWNNPTLATPFRENLSDAEKMAGLARVWSEVRYNFANFDLIPDVDWDAEYLAAIPRALATKSTFDFYNVVIELVAKLRDGHTNAWYPNQVADQASAIPPMRQQLVDGRIVVILAGEGAPVKAGDEILEVDGQPWREYAAKNVVPFISASTKQDLDYRTGDRLLLGAVGTKVKLKTRDANGKTSNVEVERLTRGKRIPIIKELFEFRMLPGNIAYVALNDFGSDDVANAYDAHYDEIAKSRALILDVRKNGGGSTGVGYRVLSTLISKPVATTKAQTMTYRPTDRARSVAQRVEYQESTLQPDAKGRLYTKPVAVLIGPATFSAAEDFAVAWKMAKRGLTIGTPSGGSTGQPLQIALPGGGGFRVCTKRDRFANGEEFVGVGIQPDIEVRATIDNVRAGRDPVLERAIAELMR